MPIPAGSSGVDACATLLALFRQVHQQLREEISVLDDDVVNWVPGPGANSISTIVTHVVGSEAETLRCVAGATSTRDRDAEFRGGKQTTRDLLLLIDDADALIDDLEPRLEPSRLAAEFPLPTLPGAEIRSGFTWLIGNYGHAREHLGHIQLTAQLSRRE